MESETSPMSEDDDVPILATPYMSASQESDTDSLLPDCDGNSQSEPEDERRICGISVKFLNVLLMGFGFMFSIGAYQTTAIAQTVVLNSVHNAEFNGTATMGYICLGINCATQAVAYLLGPSLVAIIGPKSTIVAGGVCISLYIACFLRPLAITLYIGSSVLGAGVGVIWVVQGYFITVNSTQSTNGRNTGIFWALYQSSLVTGNLFYYAVLFGKDTIDTRTRLIVFWPLLGASIVGVLIFSLLVHPWTKTLQMSGDRNPQKNPGPKKALVDTLRFAKKRQMWIFWPLFMYIGIELSFWVNVYGTCLGYTMQFGIIRESLVGLSGVFVGLGEIGGGLVLGLLGKWSHRNGKDPAVLVAMTVHFLCFYLVYLNLPAQSPLGETWELSLFQPNQYVAMFCAFLLGFGDAVWNNQLMSFLGVVYPYETVAAFAVYQFWGSIGNTIAYFYSTILTLPFQLLLLVVSAVPAAWGFFMEEWKYGFLENMSLVENRRRSSHKNPQSQISDDVSIITAQTTISSDTDLLTY